MNKHIQLSRWSALVFSLLLTLLISACGGGVDSANVITPSPVISAANVVPISVSNGGDFGSLNSLFVSVTLCSPTDAANCSTIDRILVDTGSVGLRVFARPRAAVALSALNLTQQTNSLGQPIAECLPFVTGATWGSIKYATLKMGGETVENLAIQVIADPNFSSVPSSCGDSVTLIDTPTKLLANGILGIGSFAEDCGEQCANNSGMDVYFACSTNGDNCVSSTQPINKQLPHPVTLFSQNNNGVIITLDPVPPSGADVVNGTLTFGIDTQNNNISNTNHTIFIDNDSNSPTYSFFNASINGIDYPNSFLDTGSNAIFFDQSSIPLCTRFNWFYCPTNTIGFNAIISGNAGSTSPVSIDFDIANAETLFNNQSHFAFSNIGGVFGNSHVVDFGLPFFYGKSVHIAIADRATNKGNGPYVGW